MADEERTKPVGFWEAFWFWVKLGFINFGGPAGQIAIMHRELVERKRWVSEGQYLRTLNFCMLLPGPEAQQVATYIGWRLHGTLGGHRGGLVLRDTVDLRAASSLSYLAVAYSEVPAIRGLLYGVQPVVIAIVVEAVMRIGKRALAPGALVAFAVASFVASTSSPCPFPLVVVARRRRRGAAAALRARGVPGWGHGAAEEESAVDRAALRRGLRCCAT